MGWNKGSTTSFAGRVRAEAKKLGADGKEFSAAALSHAMGIQTYDGNKRLHWVLRDLKKAGELVVVSKGVYRLDRQSQGLRKAGQRSSKLDVMWRFLRMRRRVTVGDLQEAAGVSEHYAQQYLQMLVRREIVGRSKDGRYQLIDTDLAEAPHNLEKADKLRKMRAERKVKLLGQVDAALLRIGQAQLLISQAKDELQALED